MRWIWLTIVLAACSETPKKNPPPSADAFTIVVLPDTQYYSRDYPEIFEAQTRWIAEKAVERNIAFVVHVGDIVDRNSEIEWERAARAMSHLGDLPYVLVPGNHDMGTGGAADSRVSFMPVYFPYDELADNLTFIDTFPPGDVASVAHLIPTPQGPWLAIGLEFAPREETVEWANGIMSAFPDIPAMAVTHAYLYYDDTRYDHMHRPEQEWSPYSYGVASEGVNDGEDLFTKLVSPNNNIRLVVSGHVLNDGVGRLTSTRANGSFVHQILANYQGRRLGGEGYLRLLEVSPSQIQVRTYSPYLDQFLLGDDNEFILPL